MGEVIYGNIIFLVNQMKSGRKPDKQFFPEKRYWAENFLCACQNNAARFLKPARLSSMSLRGNPCRDYKLSVT